MRAFAAQQVLAGSARRAVLVRREASAFFLEVVAVSTGVRCQATTLDLHDPLRDRVEEVPVVRHEDHRTAEVVGQVPLQPLRAVAASSSGWSARRGSPRRGLATSSTAPGRCACAPRRCALRTDDGRRGTPSLWRKPSASWPRSHPPILSMVSASAACSFRSSPAAASFASARAAVTVAWREVAAFQAVSASPTTSAALAPGSSPPVPGLQVADRQSAPDADRRAVGPDDARQDLGERRLAGAVGADQAHPPPRARP